MHTPQLIHSTYQLYAYTELLFRHALPQVGGEAKLPDAAGVPNGAIHIIPIGDVGAAAKGEWHRAGAVADAA